jgi:hypothetical protein
MFGREFIESAVKLLTSEGYSLAAATKGMNCLNPTFRQWLQKYAAHNGPAADKIKLNELEGEKTTSFTVNFGRLS